MSVHCGSNSVYDDMEFFMVPNVSFDNMSLVSYLQGTVKTKPEQQHSATKSFAFTRNVWK